MNFAFCTLNYCGSYGTPDMAGIQPGKVIGEFVTLLKEFRKRHQRLIRRTRVFKASFQHLYGELMLIYAIQRLTPLSYFEEKRLAAIKREMEKRASQRREDEEIASDPLVQTALDVDLSIQDIPLPNEDP